MILIEDEWHAEQIGEFPTRDEALAELERLSQTPWDHAPNKALCQSWETCGRRYVLIEHPAAARTHGKGLAVILEVTRAGAAWREG